MNTITVTDFLYRLPALERKLVPIEGRVMSRLDGIHSEIDKVVSLVRARSVRDAEEHWRLLRKLSRHGLRIVRRFQNIEIAAERIPYFRNMLTACDDTLEAIPSK